MEWPPSIFFQILLFWWGKVTAIHSSQQILVWFEVLKLNNNINHENSTRTNATDESCSDKDLTNTVNDNCSFKCTSCNTKNSFEFCGLPRLHTKNMSQKNKRSFSHQQLTRTQITKNSQKSNLDRKWCWIIKKGLIGRKECGQNIENDRRCKWAYQLLEKGLTHAFNRCSNQCVQIRNQWFYE